MNKSVFFGKDYSIVSIANGDSYYLLHKRTDQSIVIKQTDFSSYTKNMIECYPTLAYEQVVDRAFNRFYN